MCACLSSYLDRESPWQLAQGASDGAGRCGGGRRRVTGERGGLKNGPYGASYGLLIIGASRGY